MAKGTSDQTENAFCRVADLPSTLLTLTGTDPTEEAAAVAAKDHAVQVLNDSPAGITYK